MENYVIIINNFIKKLDFINEGFIGFRYGSR